MYFTLGWTMAILGEAVPPCTPPPPSYAYGVISIKIYTNMKTLNFKIEIHHLKFVSVVKNLTFITEQHLLNMIQLFLF